jgi:hypothetical protein
MATLAKAENLHNEATVKVKVKVKIVRLKEGHEQASEHFFFQNSMRLFT